MTVSKTARANERKKIVGEIIETLDTFRVYFPQLLANQKSDLEKTVEACWEIIKPQLIERIRNYYDHI